MLIAIIIVLIIIVCVLAYKLHQKTIIDTSELTKITTEVNIKTNELQNIEKNIKQLQQEYNDKTDDLDAWAERQRHTRQQQLDYEFLAVKAALDNNVEMARSRANENLTLIENNSKETINQINETVEYAKQQAEDACAKYSALLEPLQLLEKQKQDKLFYTIQLPDEYKEDIDYLLTNVTPFIKHPDIISKLVWSEYMKPYMSDLVNRVGLKDEPGIYKLTNIDSGKAYVGKSANLKSRVIDHFKSAIGIKSIADQAVHHEILKTGFWNWTIEPIIYCTKDQLNDLEKYYIESFNTQVWGYNKTKGG